MNKPTKTPARHWRDCRLTAILVCALAAAISALAASPGEVTDLGWCPGSIDCLIWNAASPPGQYRLHRGGGPDLPALAGPSVDSCVVGTFTGLTTGPVLTETPAVGDMFWYLVVAATCSRTGTAGTGSAGARSLDASGACPGATCSDGVRNGTEADVDCGGACAACLAGQTCCAGPDCANGACVIAAESGACAEDTCFNSVIDGTETDVDCGGGACPGCATNGLCLSGADCASGVCGGAGRCLAPTCSDGVRNGAEAGVDCGYLSCGTYCPAGDTCLAGSDCASGVCHGGTCQASVCTPASAPPPLVSDPRETGDHDLAMIPLAGDIAQLTTCGGSGNTSWSSTTATWNTSIAIDSANTIYVTSGSRASTLDPVTGMETLFALFSGVTLGRPLVFEGKEQVGSPSHVTRFVFAGDNGFVYSLNPITLSTDFATSTRRTSADSISAPPVVQRWELSDSNYRAVRASDLVIAGTDYSNTATANRVYFLDGRSGSVLSIANPTGALQMDRVNGMVVDHARNLLFVVSGHASASSQNTVWALRTTNGSKRWSHDLGAIEAEPVLANAGLFVATRAGTLYKLDPATGATIWQHVVTTTANLTRLAADPATSRVYVIDSAGSLHAIDDACAGAATAWTFKPVGKVTTIPALAGTFLYVGDDDGKAWQVRIADGVARAWATISSSGAAPSNDPLSYVEGMSSWLLAISGGAVKKLCIPWPDTPGDKALIDPSTFPGIDPPDRAVSPGSRP